MDVRIITAIVAVVGVPLLLVGYIQVGEWLLERLPKRIAARMRPYVWVFPAVAFATVFMVLPTIYTFFFTNPETLASLKNNILWLVFFTGFVVLFGLLFSVIFDRVRYESLAKT